MFAKFGNDRLEDILRNEIDLRRFRCQELKNCNIVLNLNFKLAPTTNLGAVLRYESIHPQQMISQHDSNKPSLFFVSVDCLSVRLSPISFFVPCTSSVMCAKI